MKAHAAANDENVFIAQGLQGTTCVEVVFGIQRAMQGQLNNRNIRIRKHQLHGYEHAMVKATLVVLLRRNALRLQ